MLWFFSQRSCSVIDHAYRSVYMKSVVVYVADFKYSSSAASLQLILSIVANLGSVYLAYILAYVLNDVCVVCVTMYAVNFLVLLCNIFRRRHLLAAESKSLQRTGAKKVKSS